MKDETYSENTDLAIPGLLIPPGQRHQRQQLWKNHIANIENDQLDGLILLGSYGFHSLGEINLSTHKLWNGNLEQFRVDFQQLQAQDERDVANMITPAIKRRRRKFWVLHMLNKADIWWNQRNTVINNFAHSEPFAAIQEHMRERDRYETCATSLTMSNVVTRDGSVLFPRRPEFDQETQTSLQMKMIDTIAALQDWSDKSDD